MKIALNTKADQDIEIDWKGKKPLKVKVHGKADLTIPPGQKKKAKPKKKPK